MYKLLTFQNEHSMQIEDNWFMCIVDFNALDHMVA